MQKKPKMGGKETLRIFIKGDDDLADSLFSTQAGGQQLDRGFQELVQDRANGSSKLDMLYEPWGHSEFLLQQLAESAIPQAIHRQGFADDLITAQFQSRLFEEQVDIVVLSIQPEITQTLWKHRQEGYLFCPPPDWEQKWTSSQRQWFQDQFSPLGKLDVDQFKENFRQLVRHLKEQLDVHVIVFGCSSYDPDDLSHNYHQAEETLTERILQFNLALFEISALEGISVVDVDRLIAELGGGKHVVKALRYSKQAHQEILDEFLRVVEDVGFFEKRPLLMQIGQRRNGNAH